MRQSHLCNGNRYARKTTFLYWDGPRLATRTAVGHRCGFSMNRLLWHRTTWFTITVTADWDTCYITIFFHGHAAQLDNANVCNWTCNRDYFTIANCIHHGHWMIFHFCVFFVAMYDDYIECQWLVELSSSLYHPYCPILLKVALSCSLMTHVW